MKISYFPPYFPEEDINDILKKFKDILLGNSFLSDYKYCEEFEKKFAQYIGVKHAVTTNCGTAALQMMIESFGLKGVRIAVPANTFAATAEVVIRSGNVPVFTDIDNYMSMNPEHLRKLKRKYPDIKAAIVVHIGGLISPNICELIKVCNEDGIALFEDAAHAHGSRYKGLHAGSFGIASGFSFYSTKVLTTGEGGMMVTCDDSIDYMARKIKDHGKEKLGPYQNYHRVLGYTWEMPEVAALLGLSQLKNLDEMIKKRQEIASLYDKILLRIPNLELLEIPAECNCNYYKYIVFTKHPKLYRDEIIKRMKEEYGISLGGMVYEIPLHRQPVFMQYYDGPLPNAEKLCTTHFTLPIAPTMTKKQAEYVVECLEKVMA